MGDVVENRGYAHLGSRDAECQQRLMAAMAQEAPWMASRTGFLSMTIRPSSNGRHVVVEGRWRSEAAFDMAITRDPKAQQARVLFDELGQLDEVIMLPTKAAIQFSTIGDADANLRGKSDSFSQTEQ